MKISKIELYNVKIPLYEREHGFFSARTVFRPNWIPGFHQTDVRFYLLRLITSNGLEGVAATPAMGTERDSLGPMLGAYLLGLNPLDIQLVNQRIQEFAYIGMRNGWIDAAFWDLIGKIRREPVHKILGGTGGYAYPYASLGDNHGHDPDVVAKLVRERREEGYRGVKIRVKSRDFGRMVEVVAAARDAAGKALALMVDCNLGWPVELLEESPRWDEDFAADFAQTIERYDVAWLEEPLHRGDFEALARLRKRTKTRIAGGEINANWRDFKAMLELGSLDVYQPDAVLAGGTYAGGISVVSWLVRAIEKRNASLAPGERKLTYTPHTWTNGLGFYVNLQLYGLVWPEERGLLELPYDAHWRPDQYARFLKNPIVRDKEGRIHIPEEPGLGVEVDWNVVRRFGERVYAGSKVNVATSVLREHGLREAKYLAGKKKTVEQWSARTELDLPEPPF